MSDQEISPLAQALGRIPCGLYIVSTQTDGKPMGLLGSLLMQVGFDPPTVCVAVGKGRDHLDAMLEHGSFAVSILDADSSGLMTPFFKSETPFEGLATKATESGCLVLTDALAWFECKIDAAHEGGDHVIVFGEAVAGETLREGDPKIHLRKNGLGY